MTKIPYFAQAVVSRARSAPTESARRRPASRVRSLAADLSAASPSDSAIPLTRSAVAVTLF